MSRSSVVSSTSLGTHRIVDTISDKTNLRIEAKELRLGEREEAAVDVVAAFAASA
jgi:hypothetical protein